MRRKSFAEYFGTEMYQRFNEWLKEQVKKQTKQIEKNNKRQRIIWSHALSGPNRQPRFAG